MSVQIFARFDKWHSFLGAVTDEGGPLRAHLPITRSELDQEQDRSRMVADYLERGEVVPMDLAYPLAQRLKSPHAALGLKRPAHAPRRQRRLLLALDYHIRKMLSPGSALAESSTAWGESKAVVKKAQQDKKADARELIVTWLDWARVRCGMTAYDDRQLLQAYLDALLNLREFFPRGK